MSPNESIVEEAALEWSGEMDYAITQSMVGFSVWEGQLTIANCCYDGVTPERLLNHA